MKFSQKLRRLTDGQNKADVSRKAGLGPTAVTNYLAKQSMPGADVALRLAKVLRVPLTWLVDDDSPWPPPAVDDATLQGADTSDLLCEIGRRLHSGVGRYLLPKLKAAEETSWANVGRELASIDPAKPLPPTLKRSLMLPLQIRTLMSDLGRYDPLAIVPADDPAEVRAATEANAEGYTLLDLIRREEDLQHGRAYGEVFQLVYEVWTRSLLDHREQLAMPLDEARRKLRESTSTFAGLAVVEAREREGLDATIQQGVASGVSMTDVEADIAADEEVFRRSRSSERASRQPRI